MSTLDRAISVAVDAHLGQFDKLGEAYIAHPMRLMARFLAAKNERLAIVAALHDVVEDSGWTFEQLSAEGFSSDIVDAVDALTRRVKEPYMDYVARASRNTLARPVKIADLIDNSDEGRLSLLPAADQARLRAKYSAALAALATSKEKP